MSKLLINEPPLQVLPSLAAAIGLNEAIALQQLHYWLERSEHVRAGADGLERRWVHKTAEEWVVEMPFWSVRTVRRIFSSLHEKRLILVEQFGKDEGDMTFWYSLDYTHVDKLATCPPSGQDDQMHVDKLATSDKETETTLAETTKTPTLTNPTNPETVEAGGEAEPGHVGQGGLIEKIRGLGLGRVFSPSPPAASGEPPPGRSAWPVLLMTGMSDRGARQLIARHSDTAILRQVAHLEFLLGRGEKVRSVPGKLSAMIRAEWILPPGAEALYERMFGSEAEPRPTAAEPPHGQSHPPQNGARAGPVDVKSLLEGTFAEIDANARLRREREEARRRERLKQEQQKSSGADPPAS